MQMLNPNKSCEFVKYGEAASVYIAFTFDDAIVTVELLPLGNVKSVNCSCGSCDCLHKVQTLSKFLQPTIQNSKGHDGVLSRLTSLHL